MPPPLQQNTPPAFADPTLPLAVVIAHTQWDEPPRMRHHVTRQLMRWCNVLFVEFFPSAKTDGGFQTVSERLITWAPQSKRKPAVRLYANDPITHGVINRQYARLISETVAGIPGELKFLFSFVYDFPEIMRSPEYQHKSYVCYDEFPKMLRQTARPNPIKFQYQSRLWQHYENQVARRADLCLTPHYALRDKLAKLNPNVEMLFHAHNYALPEDKNAASGDTSIKVCFAGYIHYRLLDDWLLAVARQQDMELHLVGPTNNYDFSSLKQCTNFSHTPALAEEELFETLCEMDVLIIPLNPELPEVEVITTNSKTFQYVASGKPVVMSALPRYIDMPEGVLYRAATADEFVAQIRRAHAEDCDEYRQTRARIAAENTWDKRGDQLRETIERDLRAKGKGEIVTQASRL